MRGRHFEGGVVECGISRGRAMARVAALKCGLFDHETFYSDYKRLLL